MGSGWVSVCVGVHECMYEHARKDIRLRGERVSSTRAGNGARNGRVRRPEDSDLPGGVGRGVDGEGGRGAVMRVAVGVEGLSC